MKTETTIGLLAACCTTWAFFPQVLRTIKTRDTSGLSLWMYVIFTAGVILWLIYGFLIGDVPLMAANAVTAVLSGIVLCLKVRNG